VVEEILFKTGQAALLALGMVQNKEQKSKPRFPYLFCTNYLLGKLRHAQFRDF
jgi:hypothetical protein